MVPWDEIVRQAESERPCRGFCNEEGVGMFAGVFCIDEEGHDGGHLYEDPRTLALRLTSEGADRV